MLDEVGVSGDERDGSHGPGLSVEGRRALPPAVPCRGSRCRGLSSHFGGRAYTVNDDHVFLSRAGIPTVLLIDYDYPQWHTTSDTVDRCDARSLQVVGDVVLRVARAGAP